MVVDLTVRRKFIIGLQVQNIFQFIKKAYWLKCKIYGSHSSWLVGLLRTQVITSGWKKKLYWKWMKKEEKTTRTAHLTKVIAKCLTAVRLSPIWNGSQQWIYYFAIKSILSEMFELHAKFHIVFSTAVAFVKWGME